MSPKPKPNFFLGLGEAPAAEIGGVFPGQSAENHDNAGGEDVRLGSLIVKAERDSPEINATARNK